MKEQRGYATPIFLLALYVIVVLGGLGGWIANVVKIIGSDFAHITGILVMRCVGVFLAPLGAVLGYF